MSRGTLLWTPYPYNAGFCITDDTDAAEFPSVKSVYDLLSSLGIRATKTVWAFSPSEPCGIPATPDSTLRGITLEDEQYATYCRSLHDTGFEIALHGASAGNNRRERIVEAFGIMETYFDGSPTYICHSKNADNIYWEEKTAPTPLLRRLLRLYSHHACSGEIPESPYFWGDICSRKVRQIRLFRTRNTNTLAANPSMPYYDPTKPMVRGWFSATKRSFHDCTTPEALAKLRTENGLTVLYQYMHRYADPATGAILGTFREDAERLAEAADIWKGTTGDIMDRLRRLHGVFIAYRDCSTWIINGSSAAVEDLQIVLPAGRTVTHCSTDHRLESNRLVLRTVAPGQVVYLRFDAPVSFTGKRCAQAPASGRVRFDAGGGTIAATLVEPTPSSESPGTFRIEYHDGFMGEEAFSLAGGGEILRLFAGQFYIIAREIVVKGRSLKAESYLGAKEIPLEDHANW